MKLVEKIKDLVSHYKKVKTENVSFSVKVHEVAKFSAGTIEEYRIQSLKYARNFTTSTVITMGERTYIFNGLYAKDVSASELLKIMSVQNPSDTTKTEGFYPNTKNFKAVNVYKEIKALFTQLRNPPYKAMFILTVHVPLNSNNSSELISALTYSTQGFEVFEYIYDNDLKYSVKAENVHV